MWPSRKRYQYEIFLSHAVEDKTDIADQLCALLKARGIKVWYSGDELDGGGDLQGAIEEAIDQSRFGVVIFSKTFIIKEWTRKELHWLEKNEKGNRQKVIIPVLHNMSIAELAAFNPHHASKFCLHSKRGLDYIVKEIISEIDNERNKQRLARKRLLSRVSLTILTLFMISSLIGFRIYNHKPTDYQINSAIIERIQGCINTIENKYIRQLRADGVNISQAQIDSTRHAYAALKSYYRNEYEFNNCLITLSGRKRIETHLGRDLVEMSDERGYGFDSLNMYWSNRLLGDGWHHTGFSLINNRPADFSWTATRQESTYSVVVTYVNAIRFINVSLSIPPSPTGTKRHEMTIVGFSPTETFYFDEDPEGQWYLKNIE